MRTRNGTAAAHGGFPQPVHASRPTSATISFTLRHPPMGFDSGQPWPMDAVANADIEPATAPDPRSTEIARSRPKLAPRRVRWVPLAVLALLGLYAAMAWTASFSKGASFDETLQLAVGYNVWVHDDYRVEGANGDLIKRWATLPFLLSRPKFLEKDNAAWVNGSGYDLGRVFFFELGNSPEALLWQARAMNVLIGVATGLLIFACARDLFGSRAAVVAVAVFALSPSMLAFGGVVSTDMSITFTLLAATWCLWRVVHRVTVGRLAASVVAVGLLVLAKPTALVLIPIAAVMLLSRFIRGSTLWVQLRSRAWAFRRRREQFALVAALAVLHVGAGWAVLWSHYGFRYNASPGPADSIASFYQPTTSDAVPPILNAIVRWVERTRVLPEGFWRGIEALLQCDDQLGAFMDGEWKLNGGWRSFFPYAIWAKTSPTTFILLILALAACWLSHRRMRGTSVALRLYEATPHLALIACYLAIAMAEDINIGHRHVLPIYPSLYVLASGAALAWGQSRWMKIAVVAALAWLAKESLGIRPHYLAYFGPQTGGPEDGYKRLVDSSLDWGMDLPGLKRWLDEHNPQGRERVFLSYFGTDRPAYHGIIATRLPGFMARRTFRRYGLGPGYYVISASMLQGVHSAAFGPWNPIFERLYQQTMKSALVFDALAANPSRHEELLRLAPLHVWNAEYDLFDELRFARLCAWLRHSGRPPHHVGHAIFIWKLDDGDIKEAVLGPPAELADQPGWLRQYRSFAPIGGTPVAARNPAPPTL
jgi:hypothetical protein